MEPCKPDAIYSTLWKTGPPIARDWDENDLRDAREHAAEIERQWNEMVAIIEDAALRPRIETHLIDLMAYHWDAPGLGLLSLNFETVVRDAVRLVHQGEPEYAVLEQLGEYVEMVFQELANNQVVLSAFDSDPRHYRCGL